MRTTLDIDVDVLNAAKELARRERTTAGAVISNLARQALTSPRPNRPAAPKPFHGFAPLPKRGGIVTNELIDRLREDDVY
jgi:hypothetical protein